MKGVWSKDGVWRLGAAGELWADGDERLVKARKGFG